MALTFMAFVPQIVSDIINKGHGRARAAAPSANISGMPPSAMFRNGPILSRPTRARRALMAVPVTLEIFTDYVCPWCYVSPVRIEKLKGAFEVEPRLVHFPLHPDSPPEGHSMAEVHAGR